MGRNTKEKKRLTKIDYQNMWGEEGPYSQVRLCEEVRILDDSISRIFLVVEAEINPFTFEWTEKNRERFLDDEAVLQLLDHAENRGEFGYVVSAGEVEFTDETTRHFARTQVDMAIRIIIRLHKAVIDEFNLVERSGLGILKNHRLSNIKHVWNEEGGGVEIINEVAWNYEGFVHSESGAKNNKIRFFSVLVFDESFVFSKQIAKKFLEALMMISTRFNVGIEDCESFREYMLLTTLIPNNVSPTDYIDSVLDECNKKGKKTLFQKDYLVTNLKKPTQEQVLTFLKQLSIDKDTPIH